MLTFLGLLTSVALAVIAACAVLALRQLQRSRRDAVRLQLLDLFGPVREHAPHDPKLLLSWYPLGRAVRALWPDVCHELDEVSGTAFPFSREQVSAAHAQWTAEWLAWERSHDAEYKLRAAALEQELMGQERDADTTRGGPVGASAVGRARLERLEREKLESYQERYEEYVRVAKALAALESKE